MSTARNNGITHVNRLIKETSPYLIQHAHDPVDWMPWSTEALNRAAREDKPIFLSIGYSACHWCHVMARETFRNKRIAEFLNTHFISIKVDREERPDLDEIYMNAVQALTGGGGWPLSVFLTPRLHPFFGGTYFPPETRSGTIGFDRLIERIDDLYRHNRSDIETSAASIAQAIANIELPACPGEGDGTLNRQAVRRGRRNLLSVLDRAHGGFGKAPKFPQHGALLFLLSEYQRTNDRKTLAAITLTLDAMAAGGIRDHLGGGFHRYAVDREWKTPHFEKMLYDNALLVRVYAEGWRLTGDARYADVARETADFILDSMEDRRGGFYASISADAGGEEGAYYLWSSGQIRDVLGSAEGDLFSEAYGVQETGSFEHGLTVLFRAVESGELADRKGCAPDEIDGRLRAARRHLLAERRRRLPPDIDRKLILTWNAWSISALALAGGLFGDDRYITAAHRAANRFLKQYRLHSALPHHMIGRHAGTDAFLDGYACFANALLDLYQATFDSQYMVAAQDLIQDLIRRFSGGKPGDLYYTALPGPEDPDMPVRPRGAFDASLPSPLACAWEVLLRMGVISGEPVFEEAAARCEALLTEGLRRMPGSNFYALRLASQQLLPRTTIVLTGCDDDDRFRQLAASARRAIRSGVSLFWSAPELPESVRRLSPFLRLHGARAEDAMAYVCSGYACTRLIDSADSLDLLLKEGRFDSTQHQ